MKKKILFILHLPPPVHGAAMVGKTIQESTLINTHFDADYINLSTSSSMEELDSFTIKKIAKLAQIQSLVIKALCSKKYDLCYVTLNAAGTGFYKDLLVVFFLKLFGKKIIYHFHNKGVSNNSSRWIDNLLYRFAFYKTQTILLSPSLYADVKKYVLPRQVYYCPNGVQVVESYTRPDHSSAEGQRCRLLFLSNMVVEKGALVLLEACKLLKESGYAFECHFVGAWSNITAPVFQNLIANYHLTEHVFAHGPKFQEEKKKFFVEADVFVLPTYYHNECFPLVLLEAMSYGLPVVSTTEGGIPDIVINNETGFVIPKNNVADLAAKLKTLISDPVLRQKFGDKGRRRFMELFTREKFEQNLVEIFESATSGIH